MPYITSSIRGSQESQQYAVKEQTDIAQIKSKKSNLSTLLAEVQKRALKQEERKQKMDRDKPPESP